jgi:hypothetical protein
LKLSSPALPGITSVSPLTHTLLVQVAPDDAEPGLCAEIDAVHFRGKRSRARFADRTGGVPPARGITSAKLQRRGDAVSLKLTGDVVLGATASERYRIAVATRALAEPAAPVRCAVRSLAVIGGEPVAPAQR